MKFETVRRSVLGKAKGEFANILYEKALPIRSAFKDSVVAVKRSSGVVRFGVAYDNIGKVIEGRADGTLPAENAGLQWGRWTMYPYFIENKGMNYLRCSLVPGNKFTTEYFLNGRKCSKEELLPYCTAAAFPVHTTEQAVFSINTDNILAIR
jgi:hypothetical protein